MKFSKYILLNYRSFFLIFLICVPKFILNLLNRLLNKRGLADNVLISNYGGSDIKN